MSKKIILCADGTWNEPETQDGERIGPKSTNVHKISRVLLDDTRDGYSATTGHLDRAPQWIFYDRGVGTEKLHKIRGGIFGWGLSKNILDLYTRLVKSYQPGDEIYCFGFSRGAYTVRSLVGLIHRFGVLEKYDENRVAEVLKLYQKRFDWLSGREKIASFKQKYSWDVPVTFIDVWDTVGALGIPVKRFQRLTMWRTQFHDVKLSPIVKHAYHAVSIDEKRESFRPALWDTSGCTAAQSVEQMWFSGTHSNIGGGYSDTGLSDTTLQLMVEKAENAGLVFRENWRDVVSLRASHKSKLVKTCKRGWIVLPKHTRFIGTNEPIHSSVRRRLNEVENYDPENVNAYVLARERLSKTWMSPPLLHSAPS